MMAVRRWLVLAAVLLLTSLDLRCSSSSPPCPKPCTCQRTPLLNCSSSGLSSVPQLVQDSISELDLSHNLLSSVTFHQPHPNLRNLWLGNNSVPHFSLCIEKTVKSRHFRVPSARSGLRCLTWAPALQLLSAERNLLEQLPEGLDAVGSLQVLQLSFNRISSLEPGVLSNLHQLRELYLQHNLIAHLHPQQFHNLDQLKILDLSFNKLTSMQLLTYLTLRNIGAGVALGGNRWHCDCNTRVVRRRMAYDRFRGLQTWNIICAFPSTISGKDLLQLDEEDLKCINTENNLSLHRDVTIYSGTEILLSCSAQGSEWWTPSGQASVSQDEARLLISDFSEEHTGLYACVSEEDQILSVFNLQISKTGGARKARDLPRVNSRISPQESKNGTPGETPNGVTQSDLALAVCLSIFFTFLLAFILGVLARPCIDRLWGRVRKKKAPPVTHTVNSVQQRQYDNEAFSNAEEAEGIEHHRERRVTFSRVEFTQERNVQYYDTVASGDQENIRSDEVFEYQEAEVDLHKHRKKQQGDDSSSNDLDEERLRNMKFEHIPDPDELVERGSLSSSSDSSQSALEADQMTRNNTMPNSLQQVENSLQRRAAATKTEIPQIPLKDKNTFPGSSSLPSVKTLQTDSDTSQDNEEPFEFSDGAQSPSTRASSLGDSLSGVQSKTAVKQKNPGDAQDYSSSSDSSDSEPTQTKIKQKTNKKQKKVALLSKPAAYSSSSYSESEEKIKYVDVKGRMNTEQLPFQKPKTKMYYSDGSWPAVDLQHISRLKRRLDIKALFPSSDSSASSECEGEPRGHVTTKTQDELMMARRPDNVSEAVSPMPENKRIGLEPGKAKPIERPLDIKVPTADSDSSTSSDSDEETTHSIVKNKPGRMDVGHMSFQESSPKTIGPDGKWPTINLQNRPHIKGRLDIRAPTVDSESSSNSDSEDQTSGSVIKKRKEDVLMSKLLAKVPPTVPDLGKTTGFQKPLDIKTPSTDSESSSSSDSDNERKYQMAHKEHKELQISKIPVHVSTSQKPTNQWPTLDLTGKKRITRRLDIKAPKADSDLSSSSGSEDATRGHLIKQKQNDLLMSKLPAKVPPTVHPKPENRWPGPDLGKETELKRPIPIKTPSTDSDSSSSSDSERKDYMTKKKHEELHVSKHPGNVSTSQKPANQWPTLDLSRKTRIKRRLDIKAPTLDSDSSSSSDSEDETRGHMVKQKQEEMLITNLQAKVPPTVLPKPENRRPAPDLGKTTKIKKPLDTKTLSTDSDSSSSSDSDNERKDCMTQKKHEVLHVSKHPVNVSTSQKPANQWPTLDLARKTRIKRRLDIKAPTAAKDSISSSDSEDETRGHLINQNQDDLLMSKLPANVPPTLHPKPQNHWPAPNFGKTAEFKKSLDIKTPSTDSDSSSSSDNERKDFMTPKKDEELHLSKVPTNTSTAAQKPANQWPTLDLTTKTLIKRRLDIKAPTADSDSSSSGDSEDETRGHIVKQKQEDLLISKLPAKVPPTVLSKQENRWPAPDLGKTTEIKKPLYIKTPSTDSDSSSSSDNERKDYMTPKKDEELHLSKVPANTSTAAQKPANQWPTLDLTTETRIKRRLDIKAPTADSDSSSSSDSEDETRGHIVKQKQEEMLMSKLPAKVPPTVRPKPENRWPAPDLGKTTEIKKPLDIKTPSTDSDSSSSSNSDIERKDNMTQKKHEELHLSKVPTITSTVVQKPANQWPTLDLTRKTLIKRRLDIKAPTADSDSPSSSDSEDETRGHLVKQKQEQLLTSKLQAKVPPTVLPKPENRWPAPDLGKTEIKKTLDIKTPLTDSDSSSSSDSENESKNHNQEELLATEMPTNLSTAVQKAANQWPALDFVRKTRIKRRLDIRAPTADSDSHCSSDSDHETRGHMVKQKQEELLMYKRPSKASPTESPKPENRWSVSDFGKLTQFKKPQQIKAESIDSDSSSSSDSDDERKDHITQKKQEELHLSKIPVHVSTSQKPENQWPTIDLARKTRIKRCLDIKAPTAGSDSSSNSESENETRGHLIKQNQDDLLMSKLPANVPPTLHPKPENHWPASDLGKTTEFKKCLDIKTQSTDSDSSSSDSDKESNDSVTQKNQEELHISKQPTCVSTATQKSARQWPLLDLARKTRIKRRLDIKATTEDSDSLSCGDTEDKTRDHVVKQKQEELLMSKRPSQISPTEIPKPANRWSASDFGKATKFKKPLQNKAQSTDSDSSSSSNSYIERKYQMAQKEHVYTSQMPANQWSTLDLARKTQIKRRLDIKAPTAASDSMSSSDSEDETRGHLVKHKQEEMLMSNLPAKVPPTVHPKPENRWPAPDLGKTEIKKTLDIKTPSTDSDSSSSSDSERKDYMTQKKHEELLISKLPTNVSTAAQIQAKHWPTLDFGKMPWIKRRLDIKAPTAHSDSLSSTDSEDETRGHVVHHKQEEYLLTNHPTKVSPTVKPKPENNWPVPDLGKTPEFKKPQDIKTPSTDLDSSSSSDNERQDSMTKRKQEELHILTNQIIPNKTGSQKQGNQWPSLDLWRIPQFKRRLDIKAPKVQVPSSDSSSSSSSEDETRGKVKTQKQKELLISKNPADVTLSANPANRWPTIDIGQTASIKRRLDIKTSVPYQSSLSSSDSVGMTIDPLLKVDRDRSLDGVNPPLTMLGDNKAPSLLLHLGHKRKHLGFKKSDSQSSSSESEDDKRDHKAEIRKDASFTSTTSEKFIRSHIVPGINIPYRTKTDHDIKLEKYTVFSGDPGDMPTNETSRTLAVDPELQSRWATMNLGVSRFRKHLEITSHAAESDLKSPPDSPFSSSGESGSGRRQKLKNRLVAIHERAHRDSSPVLKNVSPTLEGPDDKFSFSDIVKHRTNKNHNDNKDSTRSSKQSSNSSSSSSESEDETKDHSVTDLSRGVPRIKRYLNIKAPSPESSNTQPFSSQNENLTKHNVVLTTQESISVGPTDESLIAYKRSIFKSFSNPNSSFTPSGSSQTVDYISNLSQDASNDKDTSLALSTTQNTSLNEIIRRRLRQSRAKTDGDLSEKIKWAGVDHLPELPSSKPGGVDVTSTSLQQASFAESTSPSNDSTSGSSAFNILQLSKKSDATLMQKYSSLGTEGASLSSTDIWQVHRNSSQKTNETTTALRDKERRGLNALKVMSQVRRNWEAEGDKDPALRSDTKDGRVFSPSQLEKDMEVFSQHSPSASETKKEIDLSLLYGVPRYKRHSIGDSLTEASLPDPAAPQPEDLAGLK